MSSSPYRKNHSAVETVVGLCMFVFGVGIFLSFFFLFLNAVAPSLWNADPGPRGAGSKVGDNEGAEQGAGEARKPLPGAGLGNPPSSQGAGAPAKSTMWLDGRSSGGLTGRA